jgi:hypothetical protein
VKLTRLDFSMNYDITAEKWFQLTEACFCIFGGLEEIFLQQCRLSDEHLEAIISGIRSGLRKRQKFFKN